MSRCGSWRYQLERSPKWPLFQGLLAVICTMGKSRLALPLELVALRLVTFRRLISQRVVSNVRVVIPTFFPFRCAGGQARPAVPHELRRIVR